MGFTYNDTGSVWQLIFFMIARCGKLELKYAAKCLQRVEYYDQEYRNGTPLNAYDFEYDHVQSHKKLRQAKDEWKMKAK